MRIEMLPAYYGDCLWIAYGSRNMLIDGGLAGTFESVSKRSGTASLLDLFCVTHVDEDHIQGAVKLLRNVPAGMAIEDVWFNGYDHLAPATRLGAKQGEELSAAIVNHARVPWNIAFGGSAAVVPDQGELPTLMLAGDLKLTLLSPRQSELDRLKVVWEKECKKAGIIPGDLEDAERVLEADKRTRLGDHVNVTTLAAEPYAGDTAPANGSSIAFLAEHEGVAVLFGADAHSEVLVPGIERLLIERNLKRLPLAACKVPHHGSMFNNSPEFIGLLDCPRWLFSTSGAKFHHPDPQTVARILVSRGGRPTSLFFNYRSVESEVWEDDDLVEEWGYTAHYPKQGVEGLAVDVI